MRAAKKISLDRKILQELVPLNALSPERFKEVADKILVEEVKSGRYLFRKGDRDNQSIYLLDGKVNLLDGFRKVASEIVSGTDVSRYPISNMQPRNVSARAVKKSIIARIDSSLLDAFMTWDQSNAAEAVEIDADENNDWMTRILQSEAFSKIPPAMIQSLLMKMQSVEVQAGETIIRQGDEGEYFYTIHVGRCAVSRRETATADDQLLAELGEGDSFGEESLVTDVACNATVSMLTDGVLMRLTKEDFVTLMQEPLVKRISYEKAAAMVDAGAVWVDVRSPDEYEGGGFEDSVNIPLASVRSEMPELVFNAQYVICCDTGRRSGSAAFLLSHSGFDVYVLDGGISGLEAGVLEQAGLPAPPADPDDRLPETDNPVAGVIELDEGSQAVAATTSEAAADAAESPAGGAEYPSGTAPDAATAALESEAEALRSRNEALRADLEQLRETESRLTEQLEMLRGELGESGEKLADLYSRSAADADEKQRLQQENARLRENAEQQLGALRSELGEARDQLTGQQAHMDAAGETLQAAHAKVVQELQERIAELQHALEQAEHAQLRNQAAVDNDERAAMQQQFNEVAEQQAQTAARSEALEAHNAELAARAETLQQELDDSRQQAAAAEAQRAALESRIEEISSNHQQDSERLSTDHEAAAMQIQSLEQELEALQAARRETDAQLQEQLECAEGMVAGRQAAEAALEQLQAEHDAEHARHNEELAALHQSIEALRGEQDIIIEQAAADKAALDEQQNSEKSEQQAQYEAQLLELQQDLSGRANELHEMQAERDDWQQKFDAQAGENHELQQQVARLNDQVAAQTGSSSEQLQALQAELDAGQQQTSGLEQALIDKDGELAALQEELAGKEACIQEAAQQLDGLRQESAERDERASLLEQENQEAIRKAHEDLTRKNDNEKELQGQIDRLRKKLEQATLEQQQVREEAQTDIDNLREELHAERQARADERADMAGRQRELKEQLAAVASEHETNINKQSGAIEQARDAAREEERVRLRDLLQTQYQTEEQLHELQQELQQAHAEIARLHQQEKERRQASTEMLQEQNGQTESAIAQLESQLKQLTEERDQSLEEQQLLREKLNVLRSEMEVTRGLMDAGREGQPGDPVQLREELNDARNNVEIAVRLRAEAEASRDQLLRERDALREQLEGHPEVGLPLHVPSLDETDADASPAGRHQATALQVVPDHADLAGEEDLAVPPAVPKKSGYGLLGRLVGVLMVGVSALMFWLMLGIEDSRQDSGSGMETAMDQPALQDAGAGAATASPEPIEETPQAAEGQPGPAAQPAPAVVESTPVVVESTPVVTESVPSVVRAAAEAVVRKPDVTPAAAAPAAALSAGPVFRDRLKNGGKGPSMITLPGASYMMGSSGNSLNFDEGPRHQVVLSGFSIGRHEVSFAEYDRFARATGRRLPQDEGWGRKDRPVINVSWHDANAYAAWLSKQTGKTYRLPTESEWEYAIRAGGTDQRWWGSDTDTVPANCFNCGSKWDGNRTAPVGSFSANNFGLHDMAGNVQEWMQDCYRAGYADAPVDGSARLTPQCTQRAVRGGAYTSPQDSLRSARRGQYNQDTRLDNIGFRVVRDN